MIAYDSKSRKSGIFYKCTVNGMHVGQTTSALLRTYAMADAVKISFLKPCNIFHALF